MRVLQLCLKPPYPTVDGGTMAMHCVTEGLLEQGCEVKVLSVCSDKHPVRELPEDYVAATGFEAVHLDLDVHWLDAGVSLLCGESYNVRRFESRAFEDKLKEVLQREHFDVVHVESIYLAPYLPTLRKYSDAPVVLRAHNVEHQIWRGMALREHRLAKRWYLKKLALALRMYEMEHLPLFDTILCITPDDAQSFRDLCPHLRRPMQVLPFGVEPPSECPAPTAKVYHLGAMDWMPNVEGVEWLVEKVWPRVLAEEPTAELHLAGRRMPDTMRAWHRDGVTVEGEVEDTQAFLADKGICVVPLFSGSGIRVKMIEAMAAGKAVVSTPTGLQGIAATPGREVLTAESAEAFAQHLITLIRQPQLRHQMGSDAQALVRQHYDKHRLGEQLVAIYNNLIEH